MVEPVHVAVEIGDHHVFAHHGRGGKPAKLEGFVLPHFRAGAALERDQLARGRGHVHLVIVDVDAAITRQLAGPPDLARLERQHRGAPLVTGDEYVVAQHLHGGVDVIEAFELGAAMRGRHG